MYFNPCKLSLISTFVKYRALERALPCHTSDPNKSLEQKHEGIQMLELMKKTLIKMNERVKSGQKETLEKDVEE